GGMHVENQDRAKAEGARLQQQARALSAALEQTLNPAFGFTEVQAPTFTPFEPTLQNTDVRSLFNDISGEGSAGDGPVGRRTSDGGTVVIFDPADRNRDGIKSKVLFDESNFTGFGDPFTRRIEGLA